jgi:hypothetical protein
MNYFNKNKVFFWMVVFILIINLSALITFLVYYSKTNRPEKELVAGQSCQQLCRKLTLTPEQSKSVEIIQKEFSEKLDPIVSAIKENRMLMLDELSKDKPDTTLIKNYLSAIGDLQKELQKAAVWQFMSMKKICNADQCRKLSNLYYDLYGCSGAGMMQGKGKQNRFRSGMQDRGCQTHGNSDSINK